MSLPVKVNVKIDANQLNTGPGSSKWYAPTPISVLESKTSDSSPIVPGSTIEFTLINEMGFSITNLLVVHIIPISTSIIPFVNINFTEVPCNPFSTYTAKKITFEETYNLYCEYTTIERGIHYFLLDPKLQYSQGT